MDNLVKKIKYTHNGVNGKMINNSIQLFNNNDMAVDKYTVLSTTITYYFRHMVLVSERVNDTLFSEYNLKMKG